MKMKVIVSFSWVWKIHFSPGKHSIMSQINDYSKLKIKYNISCAHPTVTDKHIIVITSISTPPTNTKKTSPGASYKYTPFNMRMAFKNLKRI